MPFSVIADAILDFFRRPKRPDVPATPPVKNLESNDKGKQTGVPVYPYPDPPVPVKVEIPFPNPKPAPPRDRRPLYMQIALSLIGLKEGEGERNNPEVVKMFAASGHPEVKQDSVPWCAAFVGYCLKMGGLPTSGSLMARSYEKYGVKLDGPVYGAIVTKRRLVRGKDVGLGHVGLVVAANEKSIFIVNGNADDMVCISSIPRSQVTAYRLPLNVNVADLPPLPTKYTGATQAKSEA